MPLADSRCMADSGGGWGWLIAFGVGQDQSHGGLGNPCEGRGCRRREAGGRRTTAGARRRGVSKDVSAVTAGGDETFAADRYV